MKTIQLFASICILFSIMCLSCEQDVSYNPPDIKRSLVIYSILEPDSVFKVLITKTQNIADNEIGYVTDATVTIIDDSGKLCDTAEYTNEGVYISEIRISENKKYEILAEAPSFDPVSASDSVPGKVKITNATYLHPYEYDALNDYVFGLLTVTFQDNADENNYYELLVLHKNEHKGKIWFTRIRPFIISNEFVYVDSENQNNPQSILFNDKHCNGREVVLKIKVEESYAPYIFFRNVTKNYYQYQNSLYTYLYTQPNHNDHFFTVEPVALYSNVENGLGIIAGYSQYEYQSIMEK